MKRWTVLKRLLAVVRKVFNLKRPEFTEIDFVDLIVKDKPLFLLVWNSRNAHKLKIKSYCSYNKPRGAIVLLIKPSENYLSIYIKNVWRSKKLRIRLRHTHIDQRTAAVLLDKMKNVELSGEIVWRNSSNSLQVCLKDIFIQRKISAVPNIFPTLKRSRLSIKSVTPRCNINPIVTSKFFQYTKTNQSL